VIILKNESKFDGTSFLAGLMCMVDCKRNEMNEKKHIKEPYENGLIKKSGAHYGGRCSLSC